MKLLIESDDYGITDAVTHGILKGIKKGIIRNTGLFVNMESSGEAASQIKYYPQACFGIDINLVAGKPVSDPALLSSMVDENGYFLTSGAQREKMKAHGEEYDPYDYEQTLIEVRNQVNKFLELTGKMPEYLHGHSLITPNIMNAMDTVSYETGIPTTMSLWKKHQLKMLPVGWNPKPFPVEDQLASDVEANLLKAIPEALKHELSAFICHAGFVDEELFEVSTYTIIREKDLRAMTSKKIMKFIEDNAIELITYRDLKGA